MKLSDFELVKMDWPHDKSIWISIIEQIKNVATGEIVENYSKMIWDSEEQKPSTFIWEEGNFSCDCNRSIFFGNDECECGEGGYLVNLKNPKTGEVFYREFD